ncbi:glutathione S-transferase 1-like isoform X2 [Ostrinia furnacalis]|uniref:glutathione S-transferase 1-like isoform X2 n=1 Tax=Ostrinia furnacalis TaxID=93504 RepID=UPI00103B756A|nr:glutathione S-transferase 1-like isoform X2 [Ostrinia furnacalis]
MQPYRHCTLWKTDRSPPCRAVMMALDAMNLSITEVDVNMDKGEHRGPELSIYNPLQTLPIFKDKELILSDSHAITSYLATRYCSAGKFLPKDAGGRAIIDQLMHYDSGILYPRFRAAAYPILYENCRFVMPQQVCEIECAYRDLECMLVGRTWLGGSWPTLGDITIAATLSTLNVLVPIDKLRYPRLSSWLYRMSEEIYYITANKKGLGEFSRRIDRGCISDDSEFKCPRSSIRRRAGVPEKENKKD